MIFGDGDVSDDPALALIVMMVMLVIIKLRMGSVKTMLPVNMTLLMVVMMVLMMMVKMVVKIVTM